MKAGWRYLAQRLDGQGVTSDFIDLNLPLQGVAITDRLSGPTALDAKISPEVARLQGPDGRPIFEKWNTAIYAEHEGEIRAGAILTGLSKQGPSLQLACTGFASYPDKQPWTDRTGYMGIQVDPLDVVRTIWSHLQSQPYGNLGVTLDTTTKTPIRMGTEYRVAELDPQDDPNVGPTTFESGPVLLRWYETFDLGEEIRKLADETPFDFHEHHRWDGEVIRHYIDFGYPRLGTKRHDLRFVVGENIHVLPQIDTDEYATEIMGLGAGEGRRMIMATKSRPGRLRRAAVVQDKSAKTLRRVNGLVDKELAWRTGLDDVQQVVVRDHPHAPIGAVEIGDEILIEGRVGWGDLDVWARVVEVGIQPEQGDAMEMTVIRSDKIAS